MLDAASVLGDRLTAAIHAAFDLEGVDPVLRPSQFADTQANAALALAKRVGSNPRAVAAAILEKLDIADVGEVEVSGPGFLNITVSPQWIAGQIATLVADERLGVPRQEPRTIPSTTPRRTWPRRCMWGTCAPRSWATASRAPWRPSGTA